MKGRSHRPPPSAPLEDWGDGQWTVDCSCGVNFDDGEEMVSCDECGVWVHTRCSRYVRGEVSFACHKCKVASKRSRSVMVSTANNFIHDTEETEVAQLLVELPTKADHPPPIPLVGSSYRPPFRLWAHVPMEERVHVQGVPGGDPSFFRGLSSSIFSQELWKCTGYVPKKFKFKYKEFPCWEEEERDKASRGADALFSLSKEVVQDVPAKTIEKILSPDGSRKNVMDKFLLDTRPLGCVKKERNKLRSSHSSKGRKEEPGEEKESGGRKRSRGDFDRVLGDVKEKAGSVPMFDSVKEDLEDGGLQIDDFDVPDNKIMFNREDTLLKSRCKVPNEAMDNNNKTKHLLVFKTSRRRLSDESLRPKVSLEPVKVDQQDGRGLCKLDTAVACLVECMDTAKGFTKQEDVAFKEPKDGSCVSTVANGGPSGAINCSEKMKGAIYSNGNLTDVPDIISSSFSCSSSTKKVEFNVKPETTDDQILKNLHPSPGGDCCAMDDLSLNRLKSFDGLSVVPEESITAMNIQPEEQKSQVMQKDSELNQSYKECINTAGSESSVLQSELMLDSAGSLRRCKDSIESECVSKIYCTSSKKSIGPNPSHAIPPIQKVVSIGKEFLNSTSPYGSKSSVSSTQNLTASTVSCSPAIKNELGVFQQPEKVHPTGTESAGSKSVQARKNYGFSPSKICSMDSKEQPSDPPCPTLPENSETSTGYPELSRPVVHTPVNQHKATSSGSSQKIDKTIQSNSHPAPKFFSHSLVMQASTMSNTAPTLSDEELALLLHQELNSSPRVPRVPRVRQTNTQFATPSTTSMLSKRAYSGGRDQAPSLRRKHKEGVSKDGFRHSRDAVSGSRRIGRHSPEAKQDESSVFSDGFCKKGKGSRFHDTTASLKANVSGASIEGANSLAISSEDNGTRTSLRFSPASVNGDETLAGLSLPSLIDEIMSKGKCSTYDELCDAVRPYWRSLRKPNGERYAYFSHSQAVLDCLRNRSEWAHLIDRGPKTNASRKRRKLDTDSPVLELEHEKSGSAHREVFPKGKRNARKRRLLERRLGNAKEATNASTLSDDDHAVLSHSSNEENGCRISDESGPEVCSSSSGDSD